MIPRHNDPGAPFAADGRQWLLDLIDRCIARAGHRISWIETLRLRGALTAQGLLLCALGLLLLLLLPPLVDRLLRRGGHLEPNFRGDRIPQSYGLVILIWASALLSATLALIPRLRPLTLLWLVACIGFGLLGL